MTKSIILLAVFVLVANANASSEHPPKSDTVHFDPISIPADRFIFETDLSAERPNISLFVIDEKAFLSNELGERFALATFRNTGVNAIKLDARDVIGVLANGQRVFPTRIDGEGRVANRGALLLHFGKHKFPLIKLETRN